MTERSRSPRGETSDFFKLLERLPFVGTVARELAQLRALLVDRRAPRILALGADGAGKTALVNALLGAEVLPALASGDAPSSNTASRPSEAAPTAVSSDAADPDPDAGPGLPAGIPMTHGAWVRVTARARQLAWLELPTSVDAWPRETERLLRNAMDEHAPDVILLVVRAARVEEELVTLAPSLRRLLDLLGSRAEGLRVLPVLTAADDLARPEAFAIPPYPTDAMARIERATLLVKTTLEGARVTPSGMEITRAIPCTCTEAVARRWNIEEVAEALFARLPESTHVEAVRALPVADAQVRDIARKIVLHFASIAVVVGLMPIPFSDAIALFPTQAFMVTAVAYVAGQPWDRRAALEWIGSLGVMGGAAVGLRWGAQQLLKLWPGGGTLISASVAGVGTEALGLSAIAYFVDGPGARRRGGAAAPPSRPAPSA